MVVILERSCCNEFVARSNEGFLSPMPVDEVVAMVAMVVERKWQWL